MLETKPTDAGASILMYHRIAKANIDPWGMCVTPENFTQQLEVIKSVGTVMHLEDFVQSHLSGTLPNDAIALTFDDGYIDNLLNALPLLSQHEVPATIFITSCNIDTDRQFWWDELEDILLRPSELPDELQLNLPNESFRWQLGEAAIYTHEQYAQDRVTLAWAAEPGTRMSLFYQIWRALWPLKAAEKALAIDQLKTWSRLNALSTNGSRRTMNSAEIRSLAESDMISIGAHTTDHLLLTAHDATIQRQDIQHCQYKLNEILGEPVSSFAYPHGEFNEDTLRILDESNYSCALTVQACQVRPGTNPMRLPRYGVQNLNGAQFERQFQTWRNQ